MGVYIPVFCIQIIAVASLKMKNPVCYQSFFKNIL